MNRLRLLFCLTCVLLTISQVQAQQPVGTSTTTFANLSGLISYGNEFATPLSNISLQLSVSGIIVDTTVTDSNGSYAFDSLQPDTYNLHVQSENPWGGVNAIDALLVLKYFTGVTPLNPMQILAADVDASGYVNSTDALQIARRFTGNISSFPAGDWVFETAIISIPQPGNYQKNLQGLCSGDINHSFLPGYNAFQVCGDTFTDLRNGIKYPTVQIGTQCWFAKNLNIGTNLPDNGISTNNGIIEKICFDGNASNCQKWGAFYSWDELMQYQNLQGSQGICPSGFHIPSKVEFDTLIAFLGGSETAGGKLKSAGYTYWDPPNTGGTNLSGFSAVGSGSVSGVQFWQGFIFSSTEALDFPNGAYSIWLNYDSEEVITLPTPKSGFILNTARCIKD